MYIDSHCHLDFPDFSDDRDEVIASARAAGVARMVTISTRLPELGKILAISDRYPEVYATVGIHPHNADDDPDITSEQIIRLANSHAKLVGLGESGLDFFYKHSQPVNQYASFRAHCAAARATQLPLVIHSRDAEVETIAVITEELAIGKFPFLIHCFSGSVAFAQQALSLGGYLSFSGIVSFKNATEIHAAALMVPEDRYLIETDSPYLAPVPNRGKRNEPSFVVHTAAAIAKIRGGAVEAIGAQSTANFLRLFNRVAAP
ncbi:MAG: TatD family hydrolase [Candidatus Pacebacteria bacterium]|nr:TatD family hydrolase [Candidatus Paceibacterota bacterium]